MLAATAGAPKTPSRSNPAAVSASRRCVLSASSPAVTRAHCQLQPRGDTHEHSNGKGNVECVALLVEAGCDTAAVAVATKATKATKRRPVLTRGDGGDASHLLDEAQRRDESRDERQGQRAVLETTRVVVRRRLCARRRSATANSDGVSWG